MNSVIYLRVSSKEQKEGYSIEAQQKLCESYSEKAGLSIKKTFLVAESAKDNGRATFDEMIALVKRSADINVVVCEKVDRLLRGDLKDRVAIDDLVRGLDKEVHFAKENIVLSKNSKSHEQLYYGIQAEFARFYLNNLSDEVKKAYDIMVDDGKYPHVPPIGYKRKLESHIAVIDSEMAPFIKKIFELAAIGTNTERKIAELMYKQGFRSRSGKRVGKSTIGQILHNPFYYGNFMWKGKEHKGVQLPIISKDLFDAVQVAMGPKGKNKSRKHNHTYTALIRCGECGNGITAETQKGHVYYHCTKPNGASSCSQKYIREEELEGQLSEAIKSISLNKEQVDYLKQILRDSHDEEAKYHVRSLNALNLRYTELKQRSDKLLDAYLDGSVVKALYESKSKEMSDEILMINGEITKHKEGDRKYTEQIENFWEVCKVAHELFASSRPELKRELLKFVVTNLILKDKKLQISFKFPFDALVVYNQNENGQGRKESNFHWRFWRPQSYH